MNQEMHTDFWWGNLLELRGEWGGEEQPHHTPAGRKK
jgi:hypothetical protein